MTNLLANETSPYLLQHAQNPVDWHPWSEEALVLSKQQNKPIFLSIGYSACHWCHVMEHESFENEQIAATLNEHFISIKVDREERPDLDQIYMMAVQAMTGHGGWPMSVFLTPDLKPFFGGTYWPPQASRGMPGFDQVLDGVIDAWSQRREQAIEQSEKLTHYIASTMTCEPDGNSPTAELIHNAAATLERMFDFTNGGFGGAPKFPHSMDLQLLLRVWHKQPRDGVMKMITTSLDKMAAGGIYDHLGGGFARYSVDARWLVPHFEKMLYDNALLTQCYLEGYQATGNEHYAQVVRETFDYILRDMTDPLGGFYSSEDADSEGEEGTFYIWTPQEIEKLLGADAAKTFNYVFDVTAEGNFEGKNILNLPYPIASCAKLLHRDAAALHDDIDGWKQQLLAAREKRPRPGCDDKILVSWNALMIDALAQGSGILQEPNYLAAAKKAANFILEHLHQADGKLLHTWRGGTAKLDGYLDDYTYLINALISLYQASFEEHWLQQAVSLADYVMQHFSDPAGGYFYTADNHEQLIARNKDLHDSSVPSGNAMAALAFSKLGKLSGNENYTQAATGTLESVTTKLAESPAAMSQMLLALDFHLGPTPEIVIVGKEQTSELREIVTALNRNFIPNKVVALRCESSENESSVLNQLFVGKETDGDQEKVFICENRTCDEPVSDKDVILAKWQQMAGKSNK